MIKEHCILQALDPIPTFNRGPVGAPGCPVSEDQESLDPTVGGGDSTSAGSQTALAGANPSGGYTSFPVDVIVYFHMKTNTFRFSCLPVSRYYSLNQTFGI